jgi:hypothetical protein
VRPRTSKEKNLMSTKNDDNPRHEVDPSERADAASAHGQEKEKDKDASPQGREAPSASSKGINPVQHSE